MSIPHDFYKTIIILSEEIYFGLPLIIGVTEIKGAKLEYKKFNQICFRSCHFSIKSTEGNSLRLILMDLQTLRVLFQTFSLNMTYENAFTFLSSIYS